MAKEDVPQEGQPRQLTLNDPVSPEELARLTELENVRTSIALRLLDLAEEEIRLLGASKRVKTELTNLFQKVMLERGLPPDAVINVDAHGRVKILGPEISEAPEPSAEEALSAEVEAG